VIAKVATNRNDFDVLLLYLPNVWEACFESAGFDLHDFLTAYCAPMRIPIVLEAHCSVPAAPMWGLKCCTLCKGGRHSMEALRFTDGTGFQFVASDTRGYTQDRRGNPYLSYNEMLAVMSRSLEIYQVGHSGRALKVTVHKNTAFKEEEILGALDAFNDRTDAELVQVVKSSSRLALEHTEGIIRRISILWPAEFIWR
jgi:hypothetical protein